jgi:hypothetical protein
VSPHEAFFAGLALGLLLALIACAAVVARAMGAVVTRLGKPAPSPGFRLTGKDGEPKLEISVDDPRYPGVESFFIHLVNRETGRTGHRKSAGGV